MGRINPTTQELTEWATREGRTLPDGNHTGHLSAASLLIAEHVSRCTIPPDTDTAIREAVCAQATHWLTTHITPLGEASAPGTQVVAAASLLGGSISYAGSDETIKARNREATALCAEASLILSLAGIRLMQPMAIG